MGYYPEFSRLLNESLQHQERSASWLAQRLGVSPSTVGRWLNDGTRPGKSETVVRVADILGPVVDCQALLLASGYKSTASAQMSSSQALHEPVSSTILHSPDLPIPATPFVGRAMERKQLSELLLDPSTRLVTILGPGGMGKTRLALAVAKQVLDAGDFQDGVAFVDLTPLQDANELPAAIANGLGLPLAGSGDRVRTEQTQVVDFLKQRQILLVLDNAEDLLSGVGLIIDMLQAAPGVTILVTSRAPLRLSGEHRLPLGGLDYAGRADDPGRHGKEAGSAASLFLQTAKRVRPTFSPSAVDGEMIETICRLVGGTPLAIELAASWITIMPAADILDAIRRSLQFLETDLYDVAERHRSMEVVFDATWQQQSREIRRVFAQMSLFRGGFSRDAAYQITGADVSQLRTLTVNSLIGYSQERDRFEVHELLRQYGALRLADWPDLEQAASAAHSNFYLGLLSQQQDALKHRADQSSLKILDVEVDNLIVAWLWAARCGHTNELNRALEGLGLYLHWRGRAESGIQVFSAAADALREAEDLRHHALALAWQASFQRALGQNDAAAGNLCESYRILEQCRSSSEDIRFELAFAYFQLGMQETAHDVERARTHFDHALEIFKVLDELWFQAEALLGIAHLCLTQGDFEGQRADVQRALELYRQLENMRGIAASLSMLADIDNYRKRLISALDLGYEALSTFRLLDDPLGIATCLSRIGLTYINLGDVANAQEAVRESLALFRELGSSRDLVIANAYQCAIELMAGDYQEAYLYAQQASVLAVALDDQLIMGVALSFVGFAQLCLGQRIAAIKTLRDTSNIAKRTGAAMEQARAQALIGLAQWQNGQGQQARAHCAESLRLASQVGDPWSLLTAIGSTTVILAAGEAPERALALHSMLKQDPLCAASRWFEDNVSAELSTLTVGISAKQVEAIAVTGCSLNQHEEASKLLSEVVELGWNV